MSDIDRLSNSLYRCYKCGRLITALEILAVWKKAESEGCLTGRPGICSCGSGHVSPTNMTPDESRKLFSYWQLIRYLVGIRDDYTRVWHIGFYLHREGRPVVLNCLEKLLVNVFSGLG